MAEKSEIKKNLVLGQEVDGHSMLQLGFMVFHKERLVKSQQEFSKMILGRKPNYFSSMKARSRNPSTQVLNCLLHKTQMYQTSLSQNPYFTNPNSILLRKSHSQLEALASRLNDFLFNETLGANILE